MTAVAARLEQAGGDTESQTLLLAPVRDYPASAAVLAGAAEAVLVSILHGDKRVFSIAESTPRDHQPIVENRDFIPRSADDRRLVEGLPEESVRRLKANGTLNEDGTVRRETAERLGWTKRWDEASRREVPDGAR